MFRYVKGHLRPYIKQCVLGPIFKLLEAVLELMMPILMAMLIDNGVDKGDTSYILKIGGLMALTALIGLLSALVCQYYASVASQGFGTSLRSSMYKKINSLSAHMLDKYGAATLTNRLTNDINQLQQAVAMLIRLVIRAPFICCLLYTSKRNLWHGRYDRAVDVIITDRYIKCCLNRENKKKPCRKAGQGNT